MLNKKALAASVSAPPAIYPEDVFSTYLYAGTGTAQTITNGIDLAGEGGLVFQKERTGNYADGWFWYDTVRGVNNSIRSNNTNAQQTISNTLTAFNSNGFNIGENINFSGSTYASWTFRKQPKFFDVVTWNGDGVAGRTIPHNLGSTPGMIIVKSFATQPLLGSSSWIVWHRSLSSTSNILNLNNTNAEFSSPVAFNSATPTSTSFTVGNGLYTNYSGATYVAYLFAHDAGGFGEAGTDNVISCGSFTRSFGTPNSVNLGFEPQYVMIKCTTQTDDWQVYDVMRGLSQTNSLKLAPNTSNSESDTAGMIPTATGFDITATGVGGGTFIYMAIRRPMKVPTTGTEVFSPVNTPNPSSPNTVTTNFPVDLMIGSYRNNVGSDRIVIDRLRGSSQSNSQYLLTNTTNQENAFPGMAFDSNTSIVDYGFLTGSTGSVYWNFRRAPNFFDVVCYTGTGSATTVAHNLGVAPELMIVRSRTGNQWRVYSKSLTTSQFLCLNNTAGQDTGTTVWNATAPTSSVFSVGSASATNASADTYVAYLFATCDGVSKVGSYTGTGATQTINCGFTGGARFVLIKRTDVDGHDWYVWDTARGIVSGNDPHLSLNTTAVEVTGDDTIDPTSSGFIVNQRTATNVNVSGGSYIFLAIA